MKTNFKRLTSLAIALLMIVSLFTVMAMNVSAAGTISEFKADTIEIKWAEETISFKDYAFTAADGVQVMYSLKAVKDFSIPEDTADAKKEAAYIAANKKAASEKWYPIYGNSIDISKYIPAKAPTDSTKPKYMIAFRLANDPFVEASKTAVGGYATRTYVEIEHRTDSKTALSTKATVDAAGAPVKAKVSVDYENNVINVPKNVSYRVSIGAWVDNDQNETITVDPNTNALAAAFEIRMNADEGKTFASKPIKITYKAQPKAPTIKFDPKTFKITGFKYTKATDSKAAITFMEISSDNENWKTVKATITSLEELKTFLGSDDVKITPATEGTGAEEVQVIYVRSHFVKDKAPASASYKLEVPSKSYSAKTPTLDAASYDATSKTITLTVKDDTLAVLASPTKTDFVVTKKNGETSTALTIASVTPIKAGDSSIKVVLSAAIEAKSGDTFTIAYKGTKIIGEGGMALGKYEGDKALTLNVTAAPVDPEITAVTFTATLSLKIEDNSTKADAVAGTINVTGGTATFTYEFVTGTNDNAKFKFDTQDANKVLFSEEITEAKTYKIDVKVTDSKNKSKTETLSIVVGS